MNVNFMNAPKIHSIEIYNDGSGFEYVARIASGMCYANGNKVPDKLIKYFYKIVDGELKLVDTYEGKMLPAYQVNEKEQWGN